MSMATEGTPAKLKRLQDGLVAESTGGGFDGGDDAYVALRSELLANPDVRGLLPDFIKRHRSLPSFWEFIKHKFPTYAERRTFIWESFGPLLDHLESERDHPAAGSIEAVLKSLDEDNVRAVWQKALERRLSDPEGAITAARTLIESACKHILDELKIPYPDDADPGKLWALCADQLNLSPAQHAEPVFKSILGNCQSIVNNLAAIRNRISDAHGKGKRAVRPRARHAELAVNLAGSMAAFLVSTWKERAAPAEDGSGARS
jgi:Abortive infection C-terminus